MNGYFKPLRRKIGVVMLVMACVLAGAWIRSFLIFDGFYCPTAQLVSSRGGVYCEILALPFEFTFSHSSLVWNEHIKLDFYNDPNGHWRWRYCGFAYRSGEVELNGPGAKQPKATEVSFIVPYWSIVPSLTLLSAWLLLSKPRGKPVSVPPIADTPANNA